MSKIEWTDRTWNPVTGCKMVHDGCRNCYALEMSRRLQAMGTKGYEGVTTRLVRMDDGTSERRTNWHTFPAERVYGETRWANVFREQPQRLDVPLRRKKPTRFFVNSMSDLFGEGVSFEFIAAMFAVMSATPQHKYVVLTKRPWRALEWVLWFMAETHHGRWSAGSVLGRYARVYGEHLAFKAEHIYHRMECSWPLPNVAIGVSVSDQASWGKFVPLLRQIPARWRIVSAEPLLGPIVATADQLRALDQVIIGAESGPGRRPCKLGWIQDLGRQVLDAQVWATPQRPNSDPESAGMVETGPHQLMEDPALFIKQADVCPGCEGSRMSRLPGTNQWAQPCGRCDDGQTGKLRKGCPKIWIPGHGTQSWQQFPKGW